MPVLRLMGETLSRPSMIQANSLTPAADSCQIQCNSKRLFASSVKEMTLRSFSEAR
jgi:hypothetical protein